VADLATLGAFAFTVTALRIGRLPRAVGLSANALAKYPMQTTDYVSGYRPIEIGGRIDGVETQDETAADHLQRQWSNLEAEVGKDANTLTLDFGATSPRVYTVYKNELVEIDVPEEWQVLDRVFFSLTLNCLP